jgi:diguanylate cyclase (GGDEF)-like protein
MEITTDIRRTWRAAVDYLPKGHTLPEGVWRVRHRTLSHLLRAHVVAIFVYALATGNGIAHSLTEAGIIAAFAVASSVDSRFRKTSSAMNALGLVVSSATLVHLSGGVIEMHFHFFVMVGIMTLYQDWVPFLVAIGFVVFHHAVVGVLSPDAVYNHADAVAQPFKWALIHGGFVLAASVASIIAWRLNEEQALRDALTRLPNRRLFQDRVSHALARIQRRPTRLAVLFIDLDGFKDVNDCLGHAAGDQLLVDVADRLRCDLRAGDTPARLGGDEFAVLVEDISGEAEAIAVADRVLAAIAHPFFVRGKEVTVGASIGIALNTEGISTDDLLRNADVAMYTAKSGGRGQYELYEHEMGAAVVHRVELERDLNRAVDNDELVIHYQPLVSLATGRVTGFEALLRWQHPVHGLLAPAAFMDIAEDSGAIVGMGAWVLRAACAQGAVWMHRHPDQPFTLSVNLSPSQVMQPTIVDEVARTLRTTGFPAARLVLELTERVMLKEGEEMIERLVALKALGVQLAVDDFGTGYSSLSYLRRLPVDILKIDKLFIDGIASRDSESAFASAIIRMAETLQLETVAEGVEAEEQASKLRTLGCLTAQGFHFARPLHPDGIDALLAATAADARWLTTADELRADDAR